MFDVNRDRADGSGAPNDLASEFRERLVSIGGHLGLRKAFRWLRDEAPRNATLSELSLCSDHYLQDIGIERRHVDLRADDLVRRLRAGG
jgi:uncharacterized protein YjiS (DUF1127 family)